MASPSETKALLTAAITGNFTTLKKLAARLDDGKGIAKTLTRVKDMNDRSVIHFAATEGKIEICKYLVDELKIDVDLKDGKGQTPLAHATFDGHLSTALYFLEKGADPNAKCQMGFTPLHLAAEIGHPELLQLLLSRGVNVDALSSKGTPLLRAASHGQADAVKILLDHSADPGLFMFHVFTPLLSAIVAKSLSCVELLLEAGADPDASSCGVTPLSVAVSEGEKNMITLLLDAGADPNLTNGYGLIPMEIAALEANHEFVQILFPLTSPIPSFPDWSFEGILRHVHSEEALEQRKLKTKELFLESKSNGQKAFQQKDYDAAIFHYSQASECAPCDATVLSNRSLCWTRKQEGEMALSDAQACIGLRPDWPKGYYREGAAWNVLKKFDRAADAFFEGLKLDSKNEELLKAFKEAAEARMKSAK